MLLGKQARCGVASCRRVPVSGSPKVVRHGQHIVTRAESGIGGVRRQTPQERLKALLAQGYDMYNPGDIGPTVEELIYNSPVAQADRAAASFTLGQGTWQVFHAPHIIRYLSSTTGTQFKPIQYKLQGSAITSNVRFSNPLLGSGWLSAGGTMSKKYDDSVSIDFTRFWVDRDESLRPDIVDGYAVQGGSSLNLDTMLTTVGRAFFFPQFSVFPVLYLDADFCVFEFTPVKSKIAVYKLPTPPRPPLAAPPSPDPPVSRAPPPPPPPSQPPAY